MRGNHEWQAESGKTLPEVAGPMWEDSFRNCIKLGSIQWQTNKHTHRSCCALVAQAGINTGQESHTMTGLGGAKQGSIWCLYLGRVVIPEQCTSETRVDATSPATLPGDTPPPGMMLRRPPAIRYQLTQKLGAGACGGLLP